MVGGEVGGDGFFRQELCFGRHPGGITRNVVVAFCLDFS